MDITKKLEWNYASEFPTGLDIFVMIINLSPRSSNPIAGTNRYNVYPWK